MYIHIYLQANASAADLSVAGFVVSGRVQVSTRLLDSGARTLAACAAGWQRAVAPYKKISDQICSILPWLPEAGVARVAR